MLGNVFFFDWEVSLMGWLQSFESGFLTALATFFSMLGEEYLLIVILGLCYWCIDKKLGRQIGVALVGSMMFGSLIKGAVLRRRPYMDNPQIKCIRAAHPDEELMSVTEQGYSCPSLHATMSTSVFGTMAASAKKKLMWVLAVALPLLVGWSRMYFGVHYPTDVFLGWCLGAAATALMLALEKKWGYQAGLAAVLALGVAGFFYCRDVEFFSIYGIATGLLVGLLFEEKRVGFEKPASVIGFLLRPIFGVAIFLAVSTLLKLPVRSSSADPAGAFLLTYRLVRYALSTFVIIGVYPLLFSKVKFLK